jgi:hypothetical protein
VVFLAKGLGVDLLLEGLCLGGGAVLVTAANVDGRVATGAGVAGEDVGGQHAANDVAEMGDVVDVGKTGRVSN